MSWHQASEKVNPRSIGPGCRNGSCLDARRSYLDVRDNTTVGIVYDSAECGRLHLRERRNAEEQKKNEAMIIEALLKTMKLL